MENRLKLVHISYKHDTAYENAKDAILRGLEKNKIAYSIDQYDINYRDDIQEYEKEIGLSDRVIMFVVPSYLKSLDCMFEMTQLFKNENVHNRLFPIVDMGPIPRNSDGLCMIKNYWDEEKGRKIEQLKTEPGGASFLLKEIQKIIGILNTLDDFWDYLVHVFTGSFERMLENDAQLLMEELMKSPQTVSASIDCEFVPSDDTEPKGFHPVTQTGEKSIYIEKNSGNITIC